MENESPPFNMLKYITNSCYQDSVFVALFASNIQNDYISSKFKTYDSKYNKKNKEAIKKEVIDIMNYITTNPENKKKKQKKSVENFKLSLREIDFHRDSDFSEKDMQDSNEFLEFLFKEFEIQSATIRQTIDGNVKSHKKSIFTILENTDKFKGQQLSLLYINNISDADFLAVALPRKKTVEQLGKTRSQSKSVVSKIPIFPDESITINNKTFYLTSIVLFNKKHYTALVKTETKDGRQSWYHHDDRENVIKKVSDDINILEITETQSYGRQKIPPPSTNGVLFFYTIPRKNNTNFGKDLGGDSNSDTTTSSDDEHDYPEDRRVKKKTKCTQILWTFR